MEINEKLDIFFRAVIEAANGKSGEILEEQKNIYQESIASYEEKKKEQFAARVHIAQNQVEKEENRMVSEQILQLKKEYHDRQDARKEELFELVEKKLEEYRKTPAYKEFLVRKIEEAKRYANGENLRIYIDPEDAALRRELAAKAGCGIFVSREAFGGGVRAVIHAKNLLMDESFRVKLAEEKETFLF